MQPALSLEKQSVVGVTDRPEQVSKAKPFLKWAGGKGTLLEELTSRLPDSYNRYFEPFIGGGALFFELQPRQAFISDINAELINAYRVVQQQPEALIEDLSKHVYERDYYYRLRDVDRTPEFSAWSDVQRASRLIFLNKTCFNGLYRVNSKGQFNVPFGRYSNPKICDAENLMACSQALRITEIEVGSFLEVENKVGAGDFVYFDPPFAPLSETAHFTSYTDQGFDHRMQEELAELCKRLDKKNVLFMLSNSYTSLMLYLYRDFKPALVRAPRMINSASSKRGAVNELLVTNY